VKLHFEVLPDGQLVCPQVPSALDGLKPELAAYLGRLDADVVQQREQALLAIKSISNYEQLSMVCQPVDNSIVSLEVFDNGFAYQSSNYQVPQINRAVERYNNDLASDLNNRQNLNEVIARGQQALANMNFGNVISVTKSPKAIKVIYGVMQPVWIQGELLLVRPLKESGVTRYQCCWLNWERIQDALRAEGSERRSKMKIQLIWGWR